MSDDALIERHSSVGWECPDDLAVVLMWSPRARRVQDGPAVHILIEPVEKDVSIVALLFAWRMLSSETISPSLARRTSPHPLRAPGPRLLRPRAVALR